MAQVRIPSDRPPTPPGEMLREEFIRPLGMTQAELADRIGVSNVRLAERPACSRLVPGLP
jgi:antitoxin HigA-1